MNGIARTIALSVFLALALALANAGCSTVANTVEPTAAPSSALMNIPTIVAAPPTADYTKAINDAGFEAQRANGWPTPQGFIPTPTLSNPPTDESGWFYVEPGECDLGTATTVGNLIDLTREMYAFIDISTAVDEAELVRMADVIIHGVPVGEIEVRPPRDSLGMTTYYQDVEILNVLNGEVSGDMVRVLQVGLDWPTLPESLEKYQIVLAPGNNLGFPGPLNQCPQVLFLIGSSAGVFVSVGEAQGVFQLGIDEKIFYAQEFKSFLGLDVDGVKKKV